MNRLVDQFDATLSWAFPGPEQQPIEYKENGKVKAYGRRFHILAAFCMGYFMWNLHTYRQTILSPEYAKYFDTTNQFAPDKGELGIDFMVLSDNLYLVFLYPFAGYMLDNYGLRMCAIGSVGQAISTWWWYFSFESYGSVLASRFLASLSGVFIACSLLPITMLWFPEKERALAVAAGTMISTIGAGAALVVGPYFYTGDQVIDISLKSCSSDFIASFNTSGSLECTEEAETDFCCVYPTAIDMYNLILALLATAVAVYTVVVMQQHPATPPSHVGAEKKSPQFWQATKMMFSKRNYSQICLADFVTSGPPLVLFSTISRIFPPSVSDYNFYVAGAGVFLAIPVAAGFSLYLSRVKNFFPLTAMAYTLGFLFWVAATICFAVGTLVADYAILILGGGALISLALWTVFVYELKQEYVYDREYSLSGFIVGYDRTIINLSSLVFVASIPPERFEDLDIDGRNMTMYLGAIFMGIGVLLVYTIRGKYDYLRLQHEIELTEAEGNIKVTSVVDKIDEEEAAAPMREKNEEEGEGAAPISTVSL